MALHFLVIGCHRPGDDRTAAVTECRYGAWSAARPISDDFLRSGSVARFPSIAATRRGPVYIVGNDIPAMTGDFVPENPLTAWTLDGTNIGRPPGTFRFAFPRAIVDDRERLHLVWGEPPAGSPPILARDWHRRPMPTSVWTAVYAPEVGWSAPRRLFDAPMLLWGESLTVAYTSASSRQWTLPVATRGPGTGIRVLGLEEDSVAVAANIPTRGSYPRVAAAGREVFVGYIAAARVGSGGFDGNSVFLQGSSDAGATWREPELVSRSGRQHAYELTTLAGPDGAVHLIWLQLREGGAPVIRHVSSADGGRTWSAPDDLEPPAGKSAMHEMVGLQGGTSGLQAVMDGCGTVHLVFEQWQDTGDPADPVRARLNYVTWRKRWSHAEPLFGDLNFMGGSVLHRAPDGRLVLALMARPDSAPAQVKVSTMYAELPIR